METGFSFNSLINVQGAPVRIIVEGKEVIALKGESVAAAVLRVGLRPTRTTHISHSGRSPYCMMGICFDCLMEINGQLNVQACMVEVCEGMVVNVQNGLCNTTEGNDE